MKFLIVIVTVAYVLAKIFRRKKSKFIIREDSFFRDEIVGFDSQGRPNLRRVPKTLDDL